MNSEKFWELINTAREEADGWDGIYNALMHKLPQMDDCDIVRFGLFIEEHLPEFEKEELPDDDWVEDLRNVAQDAFFDKHDMEYDYDAYDEACQKYPIK